MACNRCNKNKNSNVNVNSDLQRVFGNYKYLTDRQLKARLLNYKDKNCTNCSAKEECDISLFLKCKDIKL